MNRSVLSVAWYRFRTTLGGQWFGLLSIVLVVALLGGLAMGAIAGARRTQSAYPTYLVRSHASDLDVSVYLDNGNNPAFSYSGSLTHALAHLRDVTQTGIELTLFVVPLNAKRLPSNAGAIADGQVVPVGSLNGPFFGEDQPAVAQGQLADPARSGQFMATETAAQALGWHVGERFTIGGYTAAQFDTAGFGSSRVQPVKEFSETLVGIVVPNDEVVSDDIDRNMTNLIFTPALTKPLFEAGLAAYPAYELRLAHGNGDVSKVEREIIGLLPPHTLYSFHVTSVVTGEVEAATKPEAIALGVFGIIAALAALLLAGLTIGRIASARRGDLDVLRALGGRPSQTIADSFLGPFAAVFIGALLAVVVAIVLSPIAPIGAVRQVDPSPGFSVDWTVVGAGWAMLVLALGAVALVVAYRVAPHRTVHTWQAPFSRSRIAAQVASTGLPVSAVTGVRFALERTSGRTAVPVRSALIGSVVAVTLLVSTLTFGSGLNTLVTHPSLYGWNWDYALVEEGGGQVPPVGQQLLDHSPVVASWTGFNYADAQLDGQTVPLLRADAGAPFSPPILSGHAVTGNRQIVLGAGTLAALHKQVGDTVTLSYGAAKDAPEYIPPTPLRIVGVATLPAIGNTGTLHASMGTGAIVQDDAAPLSFRRTLVHPDPNLNGPALAAVRLRSGVSAAAGHAALERIAEATTRALASDPNAGGTFVVIGVQRPAEIVNNRSTSNVSRLLALGLAVGMLIALGLTLLASVRRRRRDLALLKTLGFVRRQLLTAVAWQASVAALVGIVLGVPLGIVAGRWLWTLFAEEIYAVPYPTVPTALIAVVAVVALVLANLVAVVPGLFAARTPTSLLLRAE
jgi:hypothetical protein